MAPRHPRRIVWGWAMVTVLALLALTTAGVTIVNTLTSHTQAIADSAIADCSDHRASVRRDQAVAVRLSQVGREVASQEDSRTITEIATRTVPECPFGTTRSRGKAAILADYAQQAAVDLRAQHVSDATALSGVVERIQDNASVLATAAHQSLEQKEALARYLLEVTSDIAPEDALRELRESADEARSALDDFSVQEAQAQSATGSYSVLAANTGVGIMRPHLERIELLTTQSQNFAAVQKKLDYKISTVKDAVVADERDRVFEAGGQEESDRVGDQLDQDFQNGYELAEEGDAAGGINTVAAGAAEVSRTS